MDGDFKPYDVAKSADRIKEILGRPSTSFEEVDSLPDRDDLTFTNGFYGKASAIFVDIRDSSGMTDKYKRPKLAKIYRTFISEMVAVLNSVAVVREVNIVGDCVWAVYNTPYKSDVDAVFDAATRANTLIKLLNHYFELNSIDPVSVGIGMEFGRALMIKAGYSGSGINEVVYMGDVVNRAAHLAHEAGRGWWTPPMYIGSDFHTNLKPSNAAFCTLGSIAGIGSIYTANVVNVSMNDYVEALKS
ncbi:hypothetical protein AS850_00210 [Frondihabitans sp. 762G35]|uniref:adenylate/guanylate cyclase domain-containing protein n=1 Tax=Frondihabitans sp. 762G35 TaxID=1446794 RepID=UPI000D20E401|nr:adenylate/guanylate cyclase domain-containing protein [Frondihabitans sp. 762G35]ARC55497.1 hypothetical protein AS850_00210 [Frondihabitans sp. 762G35]